ncbi:MAG: bifunctional UDP-N-acetylmuramoyl-tripeptide:D-alanyl-D-alanine ligase/alanine racemase [Rikenellaceae bacterium]
MNYQLSEIAEITGGRLIGADNCVTEIVYDSRSVFSYDDALFVAISGVVFDGHDFVGPLAEKGVRSFIVNRESELPAGVGCVVVDDSLAALQCLAAWHRKKLTYPVVAITGSNGKSIVKEWVYQLFSEKTIFRSPKSYNSQLGVALSLLMTGGDEDFAVIEAGISQRGEMERLQRMIRPDILIFTNIGEAHSENFESQEQKLTEKLVLAKECKTVICNEKYAENFTQKRFVWGNGDGVDLKVIKSCDHEIIFAYKGEEYRLHLPMNDEASRENIMHVLSLAAIMGCDMALMCRRAESITPVAMRLEMISGVGGAKVINDSYNSDYNSLTVALAYLQSVAVNGSKVVIISDIMQSGREGSTLYSDVARLLNGSGVEYVVAIGSKIGVGIAGLYKGTLECYTTTDEFLQEIRPEKFYNKTILIKGSRKFQFERISERLEDKQHATVMEVNIDALLHNFRYFKSKIAPSTKMVAMVKAMSYGSGSYEIALTLQNNGIDYLAVAYIDEGVTLRQKGIHLPIITLNSNPKDYEQMIKNRLEPEIYSLYSLGLFIDCCKRCGVEHYPIHIKLDTGMHRMGFEEERLEELEKILKESKEVRVASIFSHFSSSDTPSQDEESRRQIERFKCMSSRIMQPGTLRHLCNSAGIERFPEAHFDMVRLGLGLYGISPVSQEKLENVSTLHTRILQIKELRKGEYVGYNMRGKAERDMRVATLSIGYADGLDRRLSCGRWCMTLGGVRVPIVGNISMDTCSVDITGVEAHEGDRVTVFNSIEEINEMAEILETISYEILTSISTRIKRVYLRE